MEEKQQVEQNLARAIEAITPDVWPQILLRIEQQEGENAAPDSTTAEAQSNLAPLPASKPRRKTGRSLFKWACSVAAVLVLVFGGYFGYGYFTPLATINFDVNPSIELTVNRLEKVLSATPLNDDAVIILADMNLKNTDLNVAVNALIGSMVKNGYINELQNSILISVDSKNTENGQKLQQKLSSEVDSLLNAYSVQGAVLSQTVAEDENLKTLAAQYNISLGKAALVEQLVNQDATLNFADIANLPINDINLMISSRQATLAGVETQGQASSAAYIGEERAKSIALEHAGIAASALIKFEIKLDYEDGYLVYEIEFETAAGEYEYDIDANDGTIRQSEQEHRQSAATTGSNSQTQQPTTTNSTSQTQQPATNTTANDGNQDSTQYIGEEKAKSIALSQAGATAGNIHDYKCKLDKEDGQMVYEIEFDFNGLEYEYEINALTGEVISHKTDDLPSTAAQAATDHNSTPDNSQYIGEERAKSIALNQAGATAGNIHDYKCKLDKEDGQMVYEIEFDFNGLEYEYEIDALSGEIRKWDAEE